MSDLNLLAILENIDKLDAAASNEFLRDLCKQAAKELVELNALRLRRGTHEPVAWLYTNAKGRSVLVETNTSPFEDAIPLYTHPQKRESQGLTEEEIEDEWERITGHSIFGGDKAEGRAMYLAPDEVTKFTRAIEAKLKEKNT
jgi:hypothetical protein